MRIFLLLPFLFLIAACHKSDDCSSFSAADISNVRFLGSTNGPDRSQNAVYFDVSCNFPTTAFLINQFMIAVNNDTVFVRAQAIITPCQSNSSAITPQSKTFAFKAQTPGIYYFKWGGLPNRTDTVYVP
ncbi:hypothetical protein [Chitinophaga sp. 212800010-3]|uniref:hypothetical protein n=1 Tax=unclassified Chitinophaga TaxID=2619133 RepID=UPI002DE3CE13|nr:hypothetical protein [Chitinophaga sp. 212800010-3]